MVTVENAPRMLVKKPEPPSRALRVNMTSERATQATSRRTPESESLFLMLARDVPPRSEGMGGTA